MSKKICGGKTGSKIIGVDFNEKKYSSKDARDWLKEHKLKPKSRATSSLNYRKYKVGRIEKPTSKIITKKTSKGINLIIAVPSSRKT